MPYPTQVVLPFGQPPRALVQPPASGVPIRFEMPTDAPPPPASGPDAPAGNGQTVANMTVDELAAALSKAGPFAEMMAVAQEMKDILATGDDQTPPNPPPPPGADQGMPPTPPGPPQQFRMPFPQGQQAHQYASVFQQPAATVWPQQQAQVPGYGYQAQYGAPYQANFQQQLQAVVAPLQQTIIQLQRENMERSVDAKLAELSKTIQFDATKEKAYLMKLDHQGQLDHFARIESNYAKKADAAPVGKEFPVPMQFQRVAAALTAADEPAAAQGLTAWEMAKQAKAAGSKSVGEHFSLVGKGGQANGVVRTR